MGCAESKDIDEASQNTQRHRYRTCTDTVWLGIYILFWLFLIVIAIFSFVYGNPLRVINGYDSFGNTCGVKHNERYANFPLSGMNTIDKPELLFFDVKKLRKSLKICVHECPKRTLNTRDEVYKYYLDNQKSYCRYDFNMTLLLSDPRQNEFFDYQGPCPSLPIYESMPVLHRCVPKGANAPAQEVYKTLNSWDLAQQFLADMYSTWHIVAIICGIALLISIALVMLMHCLARIVSWIICILVIVASGALTVALWYAYYNTKNKIALSPQFSMLEEFVRNEHAVFALAVLATIALIILLIILYFLQSKLSGLSALFEEAGVCMVELPGLLLAPLLAFAILIIFLAFWSIVVICIVTASAPDQIPMLDDATGMQRGTLPKDTAALLSNNTSNSYKTTLRVEYVEAGVLKRMIWVYIIGLVWTTEFIFACQQFALAAAVAFWYFRKPTSTPTCYAIGKLIKYHLGTVAKGSFVITIFKIPRLILTYLYAKLKKSEDKGSECASCCLKCCICGFWLLEKFIRFLNHNAYTVVAIESINFCPAAGIAWNAMATNALQVATINSVGDFILFLGKVIVAALCGLIGIFMLKDRPGLNFYMAPVILILVFSFFIAHIVLSLFEMIVDTLFLCVCEDKTINGRAGRWAQSNLAHLLGEEPLQPGEEPPIQVVEMMPINKQPFSMTKLSQSDVVDVSNE